MLINHNKWAFHFKKCKGCGTTDRHHNAHGYCMRCLSKIRFKKDRKYFREYYKKYWAKNKEKLLANMKK